MLCLANYYSACRCYTSCFICYIWSNLLHFTLVMLLYNWKSLCSLSSNYYYFKSGLITMVFDFLIYSFIYLHTTDILRNITMTSAMIHSRNQHWFQWNHACKPLCFVNALHCRCFAIRKHCTCKAFLNQSALHMHVFINELIHWWIYWWWINRR